MRVSSHRLAILFFFVLAAAPSLADTQVKFHPIKPGLDFDETVELMSQALATWEYEVVPTPDGKDQPQVGTALDLYVRDWVLLGKADINGDGAEERFYYFTAPTFCGPVGCVVWIVGQRDGESKILCEAVGSSSGVRITDRVTINGFHELEGVENIYWHGDECIADDDAQDEGSRERRATLPPRDPLRR